MDCPNESKNRSRCNCTYPGCDKHALCCDCLHYHLRLKQLPACCFPDEVEKTFDRGFQAFAKAWNL
ncbi:MAG: cytosolic protein [Phycisphaerae bacterium]|nr:cytosolic protein [Phycisphaerae bacterium]